MNPNPYEDCAVGLVGLFIEQGFACGAGCRYFVYLGDVLGMLYLPRSSLGAPGSELGLCVACGSAVLGVVMRRLLS